MAEFKISRLRFTWAGTWETSKFYNRDAVVEFNGKTYVCLVPHTSSEFYADFGYITPSGASTPYWTLMLDGHQWKQEWTPDTDYALGNIIRYSGIVYVCTTEHTSAADPNAQIDLTKWTTYAQFDYWNYSWVASVVYGLGDLVKYGGIVYRCTTNHVAGLTLEADQANWEIVNNGIEYKGLWNSASFRYKKNDLVKLNGDLFIANAGHVSSTTFDPTKWTMWLPGQKNAGTWSNVTVYQPGDIVMYGGYSYNSNTINNTGNIPSSDTIDWTLLTVGYKIQNEWGGSAYKVGEVVRRNGNLFVAVKDNTGQDPTGFSVQTTYNSSVSSGTTFVVDSTTNISPGMILNHPAFSLNQHVEYTTVTSTVNPTLSTALVSTTASGAAAQPDITVTSATGIVVGMSVTGAGVASNTTVLTIVSTTVTLSNNLVVTISGSTVTFGANAVTVSDATGVSARMSVSGTNIPANTNVVSISGTKLILTNNLTGVPSGSGTIGYPTVVISLPPDGTLTDLNPVTFNGPNGEFWTYLVDGVAWKNFWTPMASYVLGDLVIWQNKTYRCIANHSASPTFRPDLDTAHQYWAVYIYHATKNAMNSQGDIVSYKNGSSVAIPIGATDKTLEIQSGYPEWSSIQETPGVYYVAPTGQDISTYGRNWDKPWKTIQFACQQVTSGTQHPNAAFWLNANKNWMVTEMYQWMLYQKSQSNAPFSPSSVFDKEKTLRDAEYIIDGIVYDITRGGNSQTVANTLAYFAEGSTNRFFTTGIEQQILFFVAALGKLGQLIANATSTDSPALSYQTLNNVAPALIVSQVKTGAGGREGDTDALITTLLSIVVTALTTQSTFAVPAPNQGLTSTIFVKTGTYPETLPISVPENVAIVGDELRGTVVQPKVRINTVATSSSGDSNTISAYTTTGMVDGTPIQFAGNAFGGTIAGRTVYVADDNAGVNLGVAEVDAIPYLDGDLRHPNGHSKIIGWALDGYPIYGPYGYDTPSNPSSSVRVMITGYALKSPGYRTGLAQNLATYPMGIFIEDYTFTAGQDLDISNGRYCVTPDYPTGTYAYFVSISPVTLQPVYPYVIGNQFYGTPQAVGVNNYTPGSGTAPYTYGLNQLTDASTFDGAQSRWTIKDGQLRIRATGLPYHNFGISNPLITPYVQGYDQLWQLQGGTNVPAGSTQTLPGGTIGYWLNGVAIHSPSGNGVLPSGYVGVTGFNFNASYQAGQNLGYTYGDDVAGGHASMGGVYQYRDYSFKNAWTLGTGSTITGIQLTATSFSICAYPGGPIIPLQTVTAQSLTGYDPVYIYGGDALKNMFLLRNGTGLRNMTFTGLLGTLTPLNAYLTQRPTGGAYASLDPGEGPGDTSAWIFRRSPYAQNITMFGQGCTGLKIDGRLHNGGNKSIVCNDYTTIMSDGIGIWTVGGTALCEAVSVFAYYSYAGYFAEDGGRIRATNGNTSYGTYGVIAEGFDITETPVSGTVYNRYSQAVATVQSSFGINANLLKLQYNNAGVNYVRATTNLLKYSNSFNNTWTTSSGDVVLQQNLASPTGNSDAWTISVTSSAFDTGFFAQTLGIIPTGATYADLPGLNVAPSAGSGQDAVFNVTVTASGYVATVGTAGGTGYVLGNTIQIKGSQLGGSDGTNDLTLTVATLSGSTILTVTAAGTVPTGTALNYTFSIYAKKGTSSAIDLYATYSGTSTQVSAVNFNFDTLAITPIPQSAGFQPTQYGSIKLADNWYRIWFSTYDLNGLNNQLQFKIWPRQRSGFAGYTFFYGAQLEVGSAPKFYLSTQNQRYTAYADYIVTGAGSGAVLVGDEVRSGSIYQTRITDIGGGAGGAGYLTASNNAQGGDVQSVVLAASDINTATSLTGMRVFINSGTGAGQFGYISNYNANTKRAYVLKESFNPITLIASTSSTNSLTLSAGDILDSLYLNMPVQFIPTYYSTTVTNTSTDSLTVSATIGGTTNILTVASTARLYRNQPITFSGSVFGGVISSFTYYVALVIDSTTFQISTEIFGTASLLNTASGAMNLNIPSGSSYLSGQTTNMVANMPIQFTGTSLGGVSTGTVYYVNDVIDVSTFGISTTLVSTTITAATASTKTFSTVSTAALEPTQPIVFSGTAFGGITTQTKYYISKIVNSTTFQIAGTVITRIASQTFGATSLIKVTDTTGFVVNNPIKFIGISLGGIVSDLTYYILAINDGTTFTIKDVAGNPIAPISAQGQMIVKTCPVSSVITDYIGAGTMVAQSTNNKTVLTTAVGTMNAIFSTPIFGNVQAGTTYYIKSINPGATNTITLTTSSGGASTFALGDNTGSMQLGLIGWDHVNSGTPAATSLDSTSAYFVEAKMVYAAPSFTQTSATATVLNIANTYIGIAYGEGTWIAIPDGNTTLSSTTNGSTWNSVTIPSQASWTSIAYGAGSWLAISKGGGITDSVSKTAYSISAGQGWKIGGLTSKSSWVSVAYGNGNFVAIAKYDAVAPTNAALAYSTNFGYSFTSSTTSGVSGFNTLVWSAVTYGAGIFVAVANGSATGARSTDGGATWTGITLPSGAAWADVTYGNGRFVAVAGTSNTTAYSFDGITWYSSNVQITATKISYGQGVFVAVSTASGTGYISENGLDWTPKLVSTDTYGGIAFGFDGTSNVGKFVTVSGQSSASVITAGCRAKGRPVITSGKISGIVHFETGSNYLSTGPALTFFDPNVTSLVTTNIRVGNGVLSGPTFVNRGNGYNTTSTSIVINGNGYADEFQTGLFLTVNNLTKLPSPGDNMTISGNSTTIYKVTNAVPLLGTVAPNITATIQLSPEMSVKLSPQNGTNISIRQKYSQVRLTGHDFLNIGYGNFYESNYPGFPLGTELSPQNQCIESNYGRVFYTSTDQDGNFKVGTLFGVEQATGIVTLSASQFGLSGLDKISLGGISVGGNAVVINQFSVDSTFVANSNNIIPTQKAIKTYLTARLSQGGSNTFTGQTTAGQVVIGGPDKIYNTIPNGSIGSSIKVLNRVKISGVNGGAVDGNMMAYNFFLQGMKRGL